MRAWGCGGGERGKQSWRGTRSSGKKKKSIFLPPQAAVLSAAPSHRHELAAACNAVGPFFCPLRRPPLARSSDINRREYLKRNHTERDFRGPRSNASASAWSQSKTTTNQMLSGGFLKVCAATEGLERGFG